MYKIMRFYAPHLNKMARLIKSNVTLEEAKEWCNSPMSKKEGVYFEGFTKE